MFKIDLRKLWSHRPIWSLKPAHHRSRFKAASSRNRHKRSKFRILLHIRPQRYSGEIPIRSDMIHVSGRDRKDDFEDDPLAPPKPSSRSLSRLIYFNARNLEQFQLNLSEIKAYLPIKTFKLRKLSEQFIFLLSTGWYFSSVEKNQNLNCTVSQ